MQLTRADHLRLDEALKAHCQDLDLRHSLERLLLTAKNEVEAQLSVECAERINELLQNQ